MAKVEINEAMCKGCGLCAHVCPKKVLEMGKTANKQGYRYAISVNDECVACKSCAIMCPDALIDVYK